MCGKRLDQLDTINLLDEETGLIDWKEFGVYQPLFEAGEEKLKVIRHRPTGHLGYVPSHVTVAREFQLWNNYCDANAAFKKKPSHYPVKGCF